MGFEEENPNVRISEHLMVYKIINYLFSDGDYKTIELRKYLMSWGWYIHEKELVIFVARIDETGFVTKSVDEKNSNLIYLELSPFGIQLMKIHKTYENYMIDYTNEKIAIVKKQKKEEKKNKRIFRIEFFSKHFSVFINVCLTIVSIILGLYSISGMREQTSLEQENKQLISERDSLIQVISTHQKVSNKVLAVDTLKK